MLFFELDFLILFLLPTAFLACAAKASGQGWLAPWIAIIASLFFLYEFSWVSAAVATLSIAINYGAARVLLRLRKRRILASAIAANLIVLAYFKYSILIDDTFFHSKISWEWRIALPLGISFYTFQQIAFLVDIYRGKVSSFNFKTYALFKLYFPQFIAGPIVHFERVRASYERWPTFNARSIRFGLVIMAIGFAKKLVGDHFGAIANVAFEHQDTLTFDAAWNGALAFSLQIYFDFSGYSDMAVGLARLFGVSLPFNFNSPYKSRGPTEFWRRWHVTLSRWLRDYLYISLGGNRHGRNRMLAALFLTMALGGLWHGAAWTFLLWGALHGVALLLLRLVKARPPAIVSRAVFLLFLMVTWIFFRSETFEGAAAHLAALVSGEGGLSANAVWQATAGVVALLCCLMLPNSQQISLWLSARRVHAFWLVDLPIAAAAVFILALAFISPETTNAFIYFEF
ncbi:MBOAT family O-acyltransferase [Hyphomicrobium sp.]|uniref:MBOAT family O-acyltransferase n=1 Tax=Hyphomicrobium sp. TaxID=82 RepID=UPI003F6F2AC6